MEDPSDKDVIIIVNDYEADGTDISWLWDVDFDRLADAHVRSIRTCGLRRLDIQLRMKYVDIPAEAVEDMREVIADRIEHGCGNLYILANYTALIPARNILLEMQK